MDVFVSHIVGLNGMWRGGEASDRLVQYDYGKVCIFSRGAMCRKYYARGVAF